ncbi:MAG: GNAT family N-acetyltransferase [Lachnospiraceae bacterium]|nr:GNAT family N-acetyltransferase [Lachnospiraceae bacterium]
MLNCVIYVLTFAGYEYLVKERAKIEGELKSSNTKFFLTTIEEWECTLSQEISFPKEELLLISDSSKKVRELVDEGYYVLGFYHERNAGEMFEQIPYAVSDAAEVTYRSYNEAYRRLAGIPWDILETNRLFVRESTVEDVDDFYRIYGEPSITYYMEDLFQNPEEEKVYMQEYIRQMYGFYGFGMWTVILKEENRIIGRAGLNTREGYDLPELGFVIEKEYQKHGYAHEACEAILKYAKEELLFDKVQALVEAENRASVKLLQKLGFVYLKDVVENKTAYQLMLKAW